MKRYLHKIRRSVKRELGRHDWASARTPSGKNLRRTFTRRVLDYLNSHDEAYVQYGCKLWDYTKKNIWKESVDWSIYYFVIAPIASDSFEGARYEIVTAAVSRAHEAMTNEEDNRIFDIVREATAT